ncbi:hypothetical protein AB0383_34395 [Amycolatopsis sp. NPDC051373]|uniref:TolB family protein n=1 Tax=Amycolatopsis sp. NPDC051373 TaxID=3155801 RepID=UPI00344DF023
MGRTWRPRRSPDSSTVVFQSYRESSFGLWTIRADGTGLRRLTSGPFDHREPVFSPDGEKIAYSSDAPGSYGIHVLDVASGRATLVTDTPDEEYEPARSPDGIKLAFVAAGTRIDVVTVAGGARSTFATEPGTALHSPMWTPDGGDLVYARYSGGVPPVAVGVAELVRGGKRCSPAKTSSRSASRGRAPTSTSSSAPQRYRSRCNGVVPPAGTYHRQGGPPDFLFCISSRTAR